MSEIYNAVMTIFKDTLELEDDVEIRLDDTFDDLDIDSLDLLEVVTKIEREFKIEIPDDAMKSIKTCGDAIDYVEKLVRNK